MPSDNGALEELEGIIGGLLHEIDASGRRKVLRAVAKDLRQRQASRQKAQKNPDGLAFSPRKKKSPAAPGKYALHFLYPSGGSGTPRPVIIKSWIRDGHLITGYDLEAKGIRSFEWSKIIKFLGVRQDHQNKTAIRARPTIRQKAMFRKLQKPRYLKTGVNDRELWVGFVGRVARLATIHQEGLRDKPSKLQPEVEYARRELLGFSVTDSEQMLDLVLSHIKKAFD